MNLISHLKTLLKNNASFLLIGIGALLIFLSNIVLKDVLTSSDYGKYSLLITYISLINSLGLLGFEQVFLRITDNKSNDSLNTSNFLIRVILIILFVGSFLFAAFFKLFMDTFNVLFWFILTLLVSISMLLFNLYRLSSFFFLAQLVNNSWKIILGISVLFFSAATFFDFKFVFWIICIVLIFFNTILFYNFLIRIKIKRVLKYSHKKVLNFGLHYLVSLLTLSFINYSDKFLIQHNFGLVELGNYFFLYSLIISPFSLIQNYVGFKELVLFKKEMSKDKIIAKIKKVSLLGFLLALIVIVLVVLMSKYKVIDIKLSDVFLLIVVFLFTGMIKINYAIFSAALGAQGDFLHIKKANTLSFLTIILIMTLLLFVLDKGIEFIAFAILLLWLLRTLIWASQVFKVLRDQQ